ncbi:MAG: protein BatD [Bacteroidales bacterium]|nr:protein BatD [Bacteroidales bacterium]
MRKTLLTLILLNIFGFICAQEMTVQAPSSVYVGDNFTVRFVVNEQAKDFRGPSFKGFSLRSGPNTSSSTSMSFVNGQMSRSVSTTFSYTLLADVEGTFTIDAATCTAAGKKVSSSPFTIKVEKGTGKRQQQQQQQAYDPWGRQQQEQPAKIDDKSLFARASVSKSNPYQGEQVIITYKIYTQIPIRQFAIDKLPGNKGFWAEDLSEGRQIKQYEETIGDRRYQVAEIRRGALFAQENGKLTIEPLNLNVLAMVQQQRRRTGTIFDLFDDPFFSSQQAVEHALGTNRINVNVRPLPTAPEGFTGGVGRFDVMGGANLDKVKANEAVSYRVTISGTGNLMLINAPSPEFPSIFEVYDPQITDNIKKGENGVSGSRSYEWILIPRSKGHYTIPRLAVIFFDPSTGQYVTKYIDKQEIEVAGGQTTTVGSGQKDDVLHLNSDINYLHPTCPLQPVRHQEHAGLGFWLALGAILLLTLAALLFGKRRQAELQDVVGMRKKHAVRMARKRLKTAEKYLKDSDSNRFYEEIYRAIWGCLSDKYNIPLSNLNRDTVTECLNSKQVPEAQQQSIMQVLQDVDLARFAPGDAHSQMQSIYDEALNMIVAL